MRHIVNRERLRARILEHRSLQISINDLALSHFIVSAAGTFLRCRYTFIVVDRMVPVARCNILLRLQNRLASFLFRLLSILKDTWHLGWYFFRKICCIVEHIGHIEVLTCYLCDIIDIRFFLITVHTEICFTFTALVIDVNCMHWFFQLDF